jgi:hypothetical protein
VARLHVKIDNLNDSLVGFYFIRSIDVWGQIFFMDEVVCRLGRPNEVYVALDDHDRRMWDQAT